MLEVAIHIEAAAGVERVADADAHRPAEGRFDCIFIIPGEERIVNDTERIVAMILPVGLRLRFGNFVQLMGQPMLGGYGVFIFQQGRNRQAVVLIHRPDKGRSGLLAGAGVRNIEHIPQSHLTGVNVQQSNTLCTTADIAVHLLIPDVIGCACGGLRALGVDEQLVAVRILVQSGRGAEKARPAAVVAGDLPGGGLGQVEICLGLRVHDGLLWGVKMGKEKPA